MRGVEIQQIYLANCLRGVTIEEIYLASDMRDVDITELMHQFLRQQLWDFKGRLTQKTNFWSRLRTH